VSEVRALVFDETATGGSSDQGKLPLPLRVFGVLCIVVGVLMVPLVVVSVIVVLYAEGVTDLDLGLASGLTIQGVILVVLAILTNLLLVVQYAVFGIQVVRNKLRYAARQAYAMLAFSVVESVLLLMVDGIGLLFGWSLISLAFLLVMSIYLDPSLYQERRLRIRLQQMEDRAAAETGTLGRDESGRGYLTLNFFNLFWIFVLASIAGLLWESIVCPIINGGVFENRTGLLWGPFSPIYGVGALLMTVALNRFWKSSPVLVFVVSGLIGAAFEFAVSWFFQMAFGILAWDYSGSFMNLDGRTDLFHALCWGMLGLFWIRICVPKVLEFVNQIPWNRRYVVTTVFAVFMAVNIGMTLLSFDCWYQRVAGIESDMPVAQFFAEHYDNDYMERHFQTMSVYPDLAAHH
jgi:uncharacterized membrane protein